MSNSFISSLFDHEFTSNHQCWSWMLYIYKFIPHLKIIYHCANGAFQGEFKIRIPSNFRIPRGIRDFDCLQGYTKIFTFLPLQAMWPLIANRNQAWKGKQKGAIFDLWNIYYLLQINGGSRISRRGGRGPRKKAVTFWKFCMSKRKNWDPWGGACRAPP